MNKPIGGRGKKAPYETTHVRVPVDLKPQIEKLIEEYRENGCVISEKIESDNSHDELPDYRKFLDYMIEKAKQERIFFVKDRFMSHGITIAKDENDVYRHAKNVVQGCRTKEAVARNILRFIFGTSYDDSRLDKEPKN
jgi:hypothetical protein